MSSSTFIPKFDRKRLDWEAAIRAALSTAIPLFVLFGIGRIDLGIYASFAAFTSLYGRSEPYGRRAVTLTVAGTVIFLCVAGGTWLQWLGMPPIRMAIGFFFVVCAGVFLTSIMQWIPRGSIFFAFAYLGCASKPLAGTPVSEAIITAAIVVALSWLIGMSGWVLRRLRKARVRLRKLHYQPERRIRAAWTRMNLALIAVTFVTGSVVYVVAAAFDIASHHYWSVVTVVAILSSVPALASFDRLAHRVIGTLLGVGVAAALFGGAPHPLYVIIVVIVCIFGTELIVGQHYGWALAVVTPLAIGATNLGLTTDWESLFAARARETILGGVACLLVILTIRWWYRRRGRELPA